MEIDDVDLDTLDTQGLSDMAEGLALERAALRE